MKAPFRYSLLTAVLLGFAASAQAHEPGLSVDGYVDDARHSYVITPYTRCVRTGYWTPALARTDCEGGAAKAEAPIEPKRAPEPLVEAPPVAAPPAPATVSAPMPAEPPASAGATARSVITGEVLFEFDRFRLVAQAKSKLDSLVDQLKLFGLEQIVVTGYADRIGGEAYNQRLSERRAAAVKGYLVDKGVDGQRIQTVGRGEGEPVTGTACRNMGRENRSNAKLIECLQPDRRAGVEASGTRPQVSSR